MKQVTPEMRELLKRAGSGDRNIAIPAQRVIANLVSESVRDGVMGVHNVEVKAAATFGETIRRGVMPGDIISGIFEPNKFEDGMSVEYPIHWLVPGTEREFLAYTTPAWGHVPEHQVLGDYVTVKTYPLRNSIDTLRRYVRDSRWDVVSDMLMVLRDSFIWKANLDGWHTLLAAAAGRNIVVYDSLSTAGLFSKRLLSTMKTLMRRNAGGNSSSMSRGMLTDFFMSPEGFEDIRSWDLTQIDDTSRREIILADEGSGLMSKMFGVCLHTIDEFGESQEFNTYFTGTLAGSLPTDKVEIGLGLDLRDRKAFKMPLRQEVEVFEDPTYHRQGRVSWYAEAEWSFAVLDSRRVILGAF